MENNQLNIILFGDNKLCSNLLSIIKIDEIVNKQYNILGCCVINDWLYGAAVQDVPYITPNELLEIVKTIDNYLVVVCVDAKEISKNLMMLNKNGVRNLIPNIFLTSHERNQRETLNNIQIFNKTNTALLVASPPKTGNVTLSKTLASNNINFVGLTHDPNRFNFHSKYEKIKIITAIREPIIQNLSIVYQELSAPYDNSFNLHLRRIFQNREHFISNLNHIYPFFELYIKEKNKLWQMLYLDKFYESFNNNIINLYKHSFDHEKGYTIVKEGNIEVFVYQLEKMNDIAKVLSDWIGQTSFDKWVKGNEASGKWITNHYKQAQNEIKFSNEYFENAYSEKWVQHFYSQEDIEKFKERWRPHITKPIDFVDIYFIVKVNKYYLTIMKFDCILDNKITV